MKVLFIDTVHPILSSRLQENGYECIHAEEWTLDEIEAVLFSINGLIIRSKYPMNAEFLDKCLQLQFIARLGAGMENIDEAYCLNRGIKLFNSPEGNRNAVAEHALGMLLTLFNHLHTAKEEIKNGIWDREGNRGVELDGKTIGIIGYGHNGKAFAKKLQGFDCSILVYDKYKSGFSTDQVKETTLDEIYQKADIISFHVPQNQETISYFNRNFLEFMKKPFYLINVSRGKIVESQIVVEGLKNNKILGAALDVLDYENASFENTLDQTKDIDLIYLLKSKNVLLTPHVAGWTDVSYSKLSSVIADKILEAF
jgi:D-3-phosphoglycerate dehydrogenase / 2-oxoglutarate reductase